MSDHMSEVAQVPNEKQMQSMPIDIRLQSTELAVRDALAQLDDALDPYHLDPDETGTIQLVMAEILNNIVEHAYPPSEPAGLIRLRCGPKDDGLHFHISDKGREMPDGALPPGDAPSVDVEITDLPEGGFGWFLIQDLAKDVRYRREAQENHLQLRIAVESLHAT